MKKVLYLHGLESDQGGPKVDYLSNKCCVHAPKIDYTRKDIFQFLTQTVEHLNPDLIIGSSMGGYSAFMLSNLYNIPIIAFNPALHSRSTDPKFPQNIVVENMVLKNAKVILGSKDEFIDPKITKKIIKDMTSNSTQSIKTEIVGGMGHRIPLDIFITKTQHEF
tara:strand:- start:248 stop:739 length:492 start_codon:yes stop_codon:yes gene_type:complete